MRHILFLLFMAFALQAIAQYPATGNKMRLGWQTTGDGLVYRGAIGDTATLDPSGINNAWMLLDTANGNLYAYRAKAWRLVSGGGGGGGLTMPFDSVTFNVNETDASLRELKYSEEKGYLQYGGQDSVQIPLLPGIWYVRNDTSVTIPKGTVLRATGTLGASGRIKVKHMIANGSIDAMYILGIAMQDIAVGADGYAMSQGKIRQVNTQAYSEGAVLYADVDTLGGLTQTEPTGSNLKLPIAFVVHSASNGTLAVRVSPGTYLRDLHDVYITSPASNASLYYNTSESVWRDTTGAVLTSDTSVFARDFQISGTAGQVAYFNAANAVTSDTAFRWSAANKTLGINTSTTSGANIIIKNSQEPSRSTVVSTQTFAADTTNWTRGTGWTFNGTAAVATAATGALTYTPALTITSGNAYEVTYTISGYSAGTLTVAVGNATYALPRHDATANVVVLLPTSATGGFRFTTSTFTGNIDNITVSVVENSAPIIIAGQDNNTSTIYNPIRMPNQTALSIGGGGAYTTGNNNNFFGSNAGRLNTTGSFNSFFGSGAGEFNTTGNSNNFFGQAAGSANTTGNNNNFFGSQAGQNNTTGAYNNYFGNSAGRSATTASNNNIFGLNAGGSLTTGSGNNIFGGTAGRSTTTGIDNVFIGGNSGFTNTTGQNNIFISTSAGYLNTTGGYNIAIGTVAGYTLRQGSDNIFIGRAAGTSTVTADTLTGSSNIAIGRNAADNIRAAAVGNVAIGNQVDLPTSNGSNQGVYQNVLFFTGASGTGTTIAAGSRAGIKTNAPASDFHVAGEVRIDDLKPTGAPRNIVGSSSTGDLSTMAWGNGLTVSVGDTVLRVDTSLILPKVNVSGTTNYLAKFTAGNRVGNSIVTQNGRSMYINSTQDNSGYTISNLFQFNGFGSSPTDQPSIGVIGNVGTTANHRPYLSMYRSAGNTVDDKTLVPYNYHLGSITWQGADGIDFQPRGAEITAITDSITGVNDMPTALFFGTTANGQEQPTERMRITSAGNVGIATSSPSRPLHVAGTTAIRIPVGNFAQRGTSGAGDIRVRSDTANLEFHNGTSWQTVINNSDTSVFARDVQISGTTNYIPKFTGANTIGNSGFIENGQEVYLGGTTNAFNFSRFSIYYNPVNNGFPIVADTRAYNAGPLPGAGWNFGGKKDSTGAYTAFGAIQGAKETSANSEAGYLQFSTNGDGGSAFPEERMRITSAGNVGINTTTPSRRLHVEGETRISDLTTDPATRIVGADADGDLDAITIGNGVTFASDTLKADTSVLATKTYVTDNAISTVYIPINLYAPGDTVANTTNSKAFFLVHSGLNGYCIDSYTVKAFSGSGTADIQIDKNGTGGNLQAISGTTTATKDTNIALATGDYIRGQVFNLSGTLVGLGLTLEIKKTCN